MDNPARRRAHPGTFATSGRIAAVVLLVLGAVGLLGDNWPTYLHDPLHSAAGSGTTLSPANATSLRKLWAFHTNGPVVASPAIVNGVVYVGSWDGYEYALDAATGALKWKTNLGLSKGAPSGDCRPFGVSSSATVRHGVVYVGAGRPFWYALSARTGKVLWRVRIGDETQNGRYYNWSSPLLYRGSEYVGIASHCDIPLVRGELDRISLKTHRVVGRAYIVPAGEVGGGIWSSPAVDPATGTIFVTTGNGDETRPTTAQPLARAVVAFSSTLALKDVWQLPDRLALQSDADWGSSPILFDDKTGRPLVAALEKNGYVFCFDRRHLSAGPVWSRKIAHPDLNASSGAFGNGTLYMAGVKGTYRHTNYFGSVFALDPATGAVRWFAVARGNVRAPLAYANGLMVDGGGQTLEVRDAATGHVLYSYKTGGAIDSGPAIANGRIVVGSFDGTIYGFAPKPGA